MNIIFIDFNNENHKNKIKLNNIKNKILKYDVRDDILNNKLTKNTYITIDKEYILNQIQNNKYSIYDKILKLKIKRKYEKDDEVNLIFSKSFDNYIKLKEYILDLFRLNSITIFNEVVIQNQLKKHDIKYIDNYIEDKKKNINKLKILIILDNIKDYDEKKLLEYILKYKFVDILRTSNITKSDYKKLLNNINSINEEYGTTIDIIQRRNLQKYDVYLLYSNLDKMEFSQKYILSSNSLYINMHDIDMDILNKDYLLYKRYEQNILTLLNRLEINHDNFSKTKLSFIFK